MSDVFITARGELILIHVPDDDKDLHTITVHLPLGESVNIFLDGFEVDKDTGDTLTPSVDGVILAADDLSNACFAGTLDDIRKARKSYLVSRGKMKTQPRTDQDDGLMEKTPVNLPPPLKNDPITPRPDLIPTPEELAEIERCICPRPGCPVHNTEAAEEED